MNFLFIITSIATVTSATPTCQIVKDLFAGPCCGKENLHNIPVGCPIGCTGKKIALVRYVHPGVEVFQLFQSGFEAQATALGATTVIYEAGENATLHAQNVDMAREEGASAIVVFHGPGVGDSRVDAVTALKAATQRALDAGIKVVSSDVTIDTTPPVPRINQDDTTMGRLVAQQAIHDAGTSTFKMALAHVDYGPFIPRKAGIQELVNTSGAPEFWAFGDASAMKDLTVTTLNNTDITVVFAMYDEWAKAVVLGLEELGMRDTVKVYGADVTTADIAVMREVESSWKATAATSMSIFGEVAVRAAYTLLQGQAIPSSIVVSPTLITQAFLNDNSIATLADISSTLPEFRHQDVMTAPIPLSLPPR